MMKSILNGINDLHERSIIHRDLKSANIFICNGIYKVADLNVSKLMKKDLAYTQTGTPYYASP
jgi:NIMA (never in mitosis gene a)-related kinase